MKKALVGFFIILCVGCAHQSPRLPTGLTPENFLSEQKHRRKELTGFSAKVSVRYDGVKESVAGRGTAVVAPGQLRLELRDPLGRVQYFLFADGKKFTAAYPGQKQAFTDSVEGTRYLARTLGLKASIWELSDLLLGMIPQSFGLAVFDWKWDASRGAYCGKLKGIRGNLLFWVDGDSAEILGLSWALGDEIIKASYEDLQESGGGERRLRLARAVVVELEQAKSKIDMEWGRLNPLPAGQASFKDPVLPADTKIIRLP